MRILLCLKPVARQSFSDGFSDGFPAAAPTSRPSGSQTEFNPGDAYALELALRLKDHDSSVRITVMTMAPPPAEALLRQALAVGSDEAVLITDPLFAGADTLATSQILAAAIRLLPPQDLILCGKKAIDAETGHIGPQLACLLGLDCWSNVLRFTDDALVRAEYDGERTYPLPVHALITVINCSTALRAPSIAGLRTARDLPVLKLDSSVIPACASGTETLSVTEYAFARRFGGRERDLEKGLDQLYERIVACI